jgi:hypothetical protein
VPYFITFFSSKNGTEKRGKRFQLAVGKRISQEEKKIRNEEEKRNYQWSVTERNKGIRNK